MAKTTRATQALDLAGADYTVLTYDYDPGAERIGLQAARSLGVSPAILLKTLMTRVDGRVVCALVPSDRQLSLKRLAAALDAKSGQMLTPAEAERVSGYVIGGVSPFGQRGQPPVVVDHSALDHEHVLVNGGGRGVQLRIQPRLLVDHLGAKAGAIAADR